MTNALIRRYNPRSFYMLFASSYAYYYKHFFPHIWLLGAIYPGLITIPARAQTDPNPPMMLQASNEPGLILFKDALEKALKKHLDLNLRKNRLEQKHAQKLSARARLLPKLYGNMRYTRNIPEIKSSLAPSNAGQIDLYRRMASLLRDQNNISGADELDAQANKMLRRPVGSDLVTKPKDAIDAILSLEIPIFNGPDFASFLQVKDMISLEQARVKEQEANTIFLATKTYFAASHKKDLVALRKKQRLLGEKTLNKIMDQWHAGLVDSVDKLRAEYQQSQTKLALMSAVLEYQTALANLGIIIGQSSEFDVVSPDDIFFEPLANNPDDLIAIAINNRPDLKAQKQAIIVASRDRLGGIFQFFPTISLKADAMYSNNTKGFTSQKVTYAVYLNAQYNFFSGLSRVGILKESALKTQAEDLKLGQLFMSIAAQIRGRRANIERLLKEQEIKVKMVTLSLEEQKKASDRFSLGLVDLSRLLEAQQQLFDAQISHKRNDALIKEEQIALVSDLGLLTPQYAR